MIVAQKIIKAFALCLAGGIIFAMIAAVIGAFSLVGVIFGFDSGWGGEPVVTTWQEEAVRSEIQNLDISTGAAYLQIIRSTDVEQVQVETNNEDVMIQQEDNTLKVVEKGYFTFMNLRNREVKIYIPENAKFTDVKINAGAGKVLVEHLVTEKLDLELGAGKAEIKYLEVSVHADIEGGAGALEINDGKLKNLDLDLGAGKCDITASITGNSAVEAGVGKLELNLTGAEKDYRFRIDKGIGSVTINNNSQGDGATYGDGENEIRVKSGVGAVEIKTLAR